MEFKHVMAFIATDEESSINRGAKRLRSSQPSVSTIIRDLEYERDTVLYNRQARGAELTGIGGTFR